MNQSTRHSKSSFFITPRILRFLLIACLAALAWHLLPDAERSLPHNLPADSELMAKVPTFVFREPMLPGFDSLQKKKAALGKALFFDKRFSANSEISCSTCHVPEKSFSDGRATGKGLAVGARKTPALINVFANSWFFWDGRADSLQSQALGPVEHPGEHGISRTHVVRLILTHYLKEFKNSFPDFPVQLHPEDLPKEAMPFQPPLEPSAKMAMYTLASLDSFSYQDALLVRSRKEDKAIKQITTEVTDLRPPTPEDWGKAWEGLGQKRKDQINLIFSYFGEAIAHYERGLVATNSAFDRFAARLAKTENVDASLSEEFGEKELLGLKLFLGPGACTNCHFGPTLSNQQFHNIGFPEPENPDPDYLDAGRSVGVILAKTSPFNCLGHWFTESNPDALSCQEIPWLDLENLENVGAFKTPTLRNVAERAPYGHDGRFPDLRSILDHYNKLPGEPFLGHREETLKPLNFTPDELSALESFLNALSSDIIDSVTGEKAKSPAL